MINLQPSPAHQIEQEQCGPAETADQPQSGSLPVACSTLPAHRDEPTYERLDQDDIAKIIRLRGEGMTLVQIANVLEVNHSTVSRVLSKFRDTSELALLTLKANAQKAADRTIDIMENAGSDVSLKAVKVILAASGVTEQVKGNQSIAIQVNVGMPGSPAGPDPFEGQTISVTTAERAK